MLSRASWLPLAEGLEPGRRIRVDHDCGPGNTLLITRDGARLRAYCFRCDESGSARGPEESLAVKLERLKAAQDGDRQMEQAPTVLPHPANRDVSTWPTPAKLWLYRAGLGRKEIGQLGVYYHQPSDRVVLPVLKDGRPIYWQARALDGRMPKYLNPNVDRSTILPTYGKADVPTLCEDILSAFKVGLVAEGWSLMGVKASDLLLSRLLARGKRVNIWLDPDPPGQRAAAKISKQLTSYGLSVKNIVSTRDPKLHTRDQIKELLS